MYHREDAFVGSERLSLHVQCWLPEGQPRGLLAVVHSMGGHSGRYGPLVDYLVPQGYALYAFDLHGHGRSPGQRGHVQDWADYRGDVVAFLRWVRRQAAGQYVATSQVPLFLFGHGLGALIVLDYVLHYPGGVDGVIVSGTPIEPVAVAKRHLVLATRLLSSLWPRFTLALPLDASQLSRDPQQVRAYREDPLVHNRATARWWAEAMARIAWVRAHPQDVTLPLLMLHGGDDPVNSAEGVREFFSLVPAGDKTLHIYPGSYHDVHHDLEDEKELADLLRWLEAHHATRPASSVTPSQRDLVAPVRRARLFRKRRRSRRAGGVYLRRARRQVPQSVKRRRRRRGFLPGRKSTEVDDE